MSAVPDVRVTTLVRAEWQRLLAGGLLVVGVGSLAVAPANSPVRRPAPKR